MISQYDSRIRFRRPPWPLRTRAWRRSRLLALSVLLPFAFLLCLLLAEAAIRFVEAHNRVEVWLQDAPAALETAPASLFEDPAFGKVDRLHVSENRSPPPGCRSDIGLGFRGLRDSELSIAYEVLEAAAVSAGLHPCPQPVFVFDDLPGPLDALDPAAFAVQAVLWAALPMAVLGLLFWAVMDRFGLAASLAWSRWDLPALRNGLAMGVVLALVLQLPAWLMPARFPSTAVSGPGLLALTLLLYPLLHEIAFRAWALALAMQSHGPRFALFWSTGLQVLASISALTGVAQAQALASGLLLGWLYLRRQSLPECVIALIACSALRQLVLS